MDDQLKEVLDYNARLLESNRALMRQLAIVPSKETLSALKMEALMRGCDVRDLMARIVEVVARDHLFKAVLDE